MATERRLSFGGVADLYDRSRPSYPDALIDEVLVYAGARRALEVGAGTGRATVLFARRGVAVHAIEPSAEMAAVARAKCAAYEQVTIEQCDFERYDPGQERFPLVYSAQAWHWPRREIKYVKAHEVLVAGGALAAFWNRLRWDATPLRDALREVYLRVTPEFVEDPGPMHPYTETVELWGDWHAEIGAIAEFTEPEIRTYEHEVSYTTAAYLALLQTHSDHIMLAPDRQAALLAEIGAAIYRHGGSFAVRYETRLCLARAC
jgi:SAM-dependent methyltransferase